MSIRMFLAAAVLATTGCASIQRLPSPIVICTVNSAYDLRVKVIDQRYGGGLAGARVTVVAPLYGSTDNTDGNGWTGRLAVPPNADNVKIVVSWPVYACPACEPPIWRSVERNIRLRHGLTEEWIGVDTTPPR